MMLGSSAASSLSWNSSPVTCTRTSGNMIQRTRSICGSDMAPQHAMGEHVPQPALQRLGLHLLGHLVLADDAVRFDGVGEFGFVELRAG